MEANFFERPLTSAGWLAVYASDIRYKPFQPRLAQIQVETFLF
jgi:hypothetical protein